MAKYEINESEQIAIIWGISEVQWERPDLDDEEAMKVLLYADEKHDANYGITWDLLLDYANSLFPLLKVPISKQVKCNCSHCQFNLTISESKCRKYDPNLTEFEKEHLKVYCRNFVENIDVKVRKMDLECDKCKKDEDDCLDYEPDTDGKCQNFIPQ